MNRTHVGVLAASILLVSGCGAASEPPGAGRTASPSPSTADSATSTPSTAPTPSPSLPPHFTDAATLGQWDRTWAARGLLVALQAGEMRTYAPPADLLSSTAVDASAVVLECGVAVRSNPEEPDDPAVLWVEKTDTPAQGVTAASVDFELVARRSDLSEIWRTHLSSTEASFGGWCDQDEGGLALTSDEQYLTINTDSPEDFVVDVDGRKVTPVAWTPEPVGRYLAKLDGLCANCLNNLGDVQIFDPRTSKVVSTFRGSPDGGDDARSLAITAATSPDDAARTDGESVVADDGVNIVVLDLRTGTVERKGPIALPKDRMIDRVTSDVRLVDDRTAVLLPNWLASVGGPGGSTLQGWDLDAQHPTWQVPNVHAICGIADGQVVVEVNGQLALLDARTGEQIDYTESPSSCDGTVADGWLYSDDEDGTVYRLTDAS